MKDCLRISAPLKPKQRAVSFRPRKSIDRDGTNWPHEKPFKLPLLQRRPIFNMQSQNWLPLVRIGDLLAKIWTRHERIADLRTLRFPNLILQNAKLMEVGS